MAEFDGTTHYDYDYDYDYDYVTLKCSLCSGTGESCTDSYSAREGGYVRHRCACPACGGAGALLARVPRKG
jgi:DnaJ-class molecular chaperone